MYDKLTGLPNRFHLIKLINKAIDSIQQYPNMIGALMFLDLNGFKNVNDSFGHATGDKVLQLVAARLETCCLDDADIARLGGDEFTLILPRCENKAEIEAFSDRVLALFEAPFEIDGQKLYLGTSIGISLFPTQSHEASQLLSMADTAMYSAKKSPNHICFYSSAIREAAEKKLLLLNDLKHAQNLGQFGLVYQQIVDLDTHKMIAVEALLRWNRSDGTTLEAHEFVPLLKDTGLLLKVGLWALQQACLQMVQWHKKYNKELKISVNISQAQLEHPDFLSVLSAALQQSELPPNKLILEIEESALICQPKLVAQVLNYLKKQGIAIAIDDFGAGLSSLSRLGSLPIDYVKIDPSFAQRLHLPQGEELCKVIVHLAQALDIHYVVEGVETKAQKERLIGMGKGYAQGYHFGWPVTADVFTAQMLRQPQKVGAELCV